MSDSEEEVAERQFKMVLLGDPQVGKTSMVTRYAKEMFTKQYAPTVGVEFYLKRAVLPGPRSVSLKMWDVGGSVITQVRLAAQVDSLESTRVMYLTRVRFLDSFTTSRLKCQVNSYFT